MSNEKMKKESEKKMSKEKKKFTDCPDSSIIFDNDIEIIGEEDFNGCPIMRMNINEGEVGFLLSYLENINNTLKDKPDMTSIPHEDHILRSIDKNGNETIPTLKGDVERALDMVSKMCDIIFPLSSNYYSPGVEKSSTYKVFKNAKKRLFVINKEKRGVLPL